MDLYAYPMVKNSKPFLRWWWFSGPLDKQEIDEQLEWIAAKGFGGVELAWVYPLPETKSEDGPRFLDAEWRSYVSYTIERCKALNIGCDLTFGTLWPFGGSFVPPKHSSKLFNGYSKQRLDRSWESRYNKIPGRILDHLDRNAFSFYAEHLLNNGFRSFCAATPLSLFCDSWEVEVNGLSHPALLEDFAKRCGYDIRSDTKKIKNNIDIRFDYRMCLSERILDEFYSPYVKMCRDEKATSRVQCHGAPTDLLAAYAMADIPETETLLFDPDFSLIAASAAAIKDKPIVSSESFSCIYGWVPKPDSPPGIGEEQIDDLRCVADAQFAWGVNRLVWHGKPYSTTKKLNRFYATVHLGPDGRLNDELLPFNQYLTRVSDFMSRGKTYSKMAVYFPLEDQWMKDELPENLVKPSSHYYWEAQEVHLPDRLLPWRPLWLTGKWLEELRFDGKYLRCGPQVFEVLYCNAQWMRLEYLERLYNLAKLGAPIVFQRLPKEPGFIKHDWYNDLVSEIRSYSQITLDSVKPILQSEMPLDFWCRRDNNTYYVFIAHPLMRKLRYPLPIGFHERIQPITLPVVFHSPTKEYSLNANFVKSRSLLIKIEDDQGFVDSVFEGGI